jgi:glutamate dehydrogenase (NADP+)
MQSINNIIEDLKKSNCPVNNNFFQAVHEVLESIKPILDSNPIYEKHNILERIVTPDRMVKFKVTWMDDNNNIKVNNGYRVQFNNALGPYKGGLRFHPSVNEDVLNFLAFEQVFKNSLTGLPIGGGKGGSDFNPKGKSDTEIMRFCKQFMTELHKYIGPRIDVPAGDIGVGSKEIGYLFGAYKKITSKYEGVLTGKPFMFGGSLMRPEATGYGVIFFTQKMLELNNKESLEGKDCVVSGAGNVAIYTMEKLYDVGAIPVACSCSKGTLYDKRGINLDLVKKIKLEEKACLNEYLEEFPDAEFIPVEEYKENQHPVWDIPCYAAFPCATQNELTEDDAKNLIKNGCTVVSEGANMPSTPEAIEVFINSKICYGPAKAANAGGVAVSEFEMSQNASMEKWSSKKVVSLLEETMHQLCTKVHFTAIDYGVEGNYVDGANIAAFKKVADAMIAEGV